MICVTAAILINANRVLIAQRGLNDQLAGKWEFPRGKIEHAETPEQCLIREMKEEFGVDVTIAGFFGKNVYNYDNGTIELLAYRVIWQDGDFKLNAHAALKWVSLNRLHEFDFAPADVRLGKKCKKNINLIEP